MTLRFMRLYNKFLMTFLFLTLNYSSLQGKTNVRKYSSSDSLQKRTELVLLNKQGKLEEKSRNSIKNKPLFKIGKEELRIWIFEKIGIPYSKISHLNKIGPFTVSIPSCFNQDSQRLEIQKGFGLNYRKDIPNGSVRTNLIFEFGNSFNDFSCFFYIVGNN